MLLRVGKEGNSDAEVDVKNLAKRGVFEKGWSADY